MKARALTAVVFVLGIGSSTIARAQTASSTELSWSAPEGCPGEPAARAEIERLLGQPLDAHRDQKLRIAGELRGDAQSGFSAALRVTSVRGTQRRELANTDCQKLTEAAALVVALAIDPKLVVPPAPESSANADGGGESSGAVASDAKSAPPVVREAPASVQPPTPLRDEPAPLASEPGTSPVWTLSLAGVGLASGGALPGVAFGAGARLSAGRGRLGLVVHGAYFFPNNEPVPGTADSQIELDLGRVGLGFCGVPRVENPSLTVCIGPVFGDMSGKGAGLDHASTEHDRWSAVLAELTVSHVTSFGLTTLAGLEAGAAIEAPRFGITENGQPVEVYRASGWVMSGYLGIGFSN